MVPYWRIGSYEKYKSGNCYTLKRFRIDANEKLCPTSLVVSDIEHLFFYCEKVNVI